MKLRTVLCLVVLVTSSQVLAQKAEVLEVFQDQVDAFNQRDVKRLVNNVTDDFKWFYITPDTLLLEVDGKEKFQASMKSYFNAVPPVLSTVEEYAIDGDRISFREVVSHKNKNGETVSSSAMGIYQIRENKISRAWYFLD